MSENETTPPPATADGPRTPLSAAGPATPPVTDGPGTPPPANNGAAADRPATPPPTAEGAAADGPGADRPTPEGPNGSDNPGPGAAVQRMLGLVVGAWAGAAVHTAVTLELPEHLAAGATTVQELAGATKTEPDALRRLLDYLVALQVCAGSPAQGYRLTATGETLRPGVPGSVRDYVRLVGEEFYPVWAHLPHTVRTGEPSFARVHGQDLYSYMADHPQAGDRFNSAMNSGQVLFQHVAKVWDFTGCARIADIGGGNGELLAEILREHPNTEGLLHELPETTATATEYLARHHLADRCQVVAGDMFQEVPAGADAYLLSRVLINHDDERAATVLRNCAAAMKPGAVVLLVERPTSQAAPTEVSAAIDLLMMLVTSGGRSRTGAELDALTRTAGLIPQQSRQLVQGFRLFAARRP
ncbi:methyltransferase [Streptantibioticus silvisoli]|uniref:Methyltransferase n=1 Tax=Streptantibioticus silvisoli TaxID=2705255 RepID=A0ABT6W562_9ACTN|nr:methyltransferase [Streptantibioticus silvisoli]MDI5965419.1 methyltransferase [Streptantibioticus silvisoli]